jgi:hypothetical protein
VPIEFGTSITASTIVDRPMSASRRSRYPACPTYRHPEPRQRHLKLGPSPPGDCIGFRRARLRSQISQRKNCGCLEFLSLAGYLYSRTASCDQLVQISCSSAWMEQIINTMPATAFAAAAAFCPTFGSGLCRRGSWWALSPAMMIGRSGSRSRKARATCSRLPLSNADTVAKPGASQMVATVAMP